MAEKNLSGKLDHTGKRMLSVKEAALYLGLSPRTVYNATAPKSKAPFPVKPKRWGKKVLFDIRDLNQFADSLPTDRANGGDGNI